MSTFVTISCDRMWSDGSCPRKTLPARTVDEARAAAEAAGWYLKPNRDLCPQHAGTRP